MAFKAIREEVKELNASRLPAIEREIHETKAAMKEIPSAHTWASFASLANAHPEATSLHYVS